MTFHKIFAEMIKESILIISNFKEVIKDKLSIVTVFFSIDNIPLEVDIISPVEPDGLKYDSEIFVPDNVAKNKDEAKRLLDAMVKKIGKKFPEIKTKGCFIELAIIANDKRIRAIVKEEKIPVQVRKTEEPKKSVSKKSQVKIETKKKIVSKEKTVSVKK